VTWLVSLELLQTRKLPPPPSATWDLPKVVSIPSPIIMAAIMENGTTPVVWIILEVYDIDVLMMMLMTMPRLTNRDEKDRTIYIPWLRRTRFLAILSRHHGLPVNCGWISDGSGRAFSSSPLICWETQASIRQTLCTLQQEWERGRERERVRERVREGKREGKREW
jgi:hypothetical protein